MTYKTYTSNPKIIPPHGGYRNLQSYQMAEIVHDFTVEFIKLYIDSKSRTRDQMEQAARSGKQNIAEGSQVSATSKKMELKLVSVARASLEELLIDYLDYIRQHNLKLWTKDDSRSRAVRQLAYKSNKSYMTYKTYLHSPEEATNAMLCAINQANYLLDRQLAALEKDFLENGGFTERLYSARKARIK